MTAQKLAAFDLDGTFFRWQLYHALVFQLAEDGALSSDSSSLLNKSLLEWQAKRLSWHDYESLVIKTLWNHLATIDTAAFELASKRVLDTSGHKIYNYTSKLARDLQAKGYFLLAITASHQELAEPFAARYGFDACVGALLGRDGTNFTGTVDREIYAKKDSIIKEFALEHNLSLEGSVAVGDSGGDIGMLALVDTPIAFNPSSELYDTAVENGWKIVIERKNVAYTMEKSNNGSYILAATDTY